MDIHTLEEQYMKITKACAILAGIWPWQSNFSKYVYRTIAYTIFVTVLFFMIARIVCFYSMDVLLDSLSYIGAMGGVLLKQGNYVILHERYKSLLTRVRSDWSIKRPQVEIDIMTKYADRAVFIISTYVVNALITVFIFISTPFVPYFLDYVLPKNESREPQYVFPTYYFTDQENYHVFINIHMSIGIWLIFYVYIACDTSYMYVVQHGCGLIAVSGYRFKYAFQGLTSGKDSITQDETYRRVCHSIEAHQHAIKYLNDIEKAHMVYFFISVGNMMVCFSVILVKVSNAKLSLELAKDIIFIVIQLIHILYMTLQGQYVLDANDEIYNSIYDAMWYNSDKKTQMLFVLVLRSGLSAPRLTAGGLITLNLQSFSDIVKSSVSYYMVLKTV